MLSPKGKNGALARSLRLGKLGVSLVGSYLGYQAQNLLLGEQALPQRRARFQRQASRRVREELGALKGPAMKLGQLLSMQTEMLPEEALQELASLQMQAPGMHASLARAQFKSSLGKYPEEMFREFDPEPFAAASLGQVHRAVTRDGEKAAVKIQYPAIRSAIEGDLKLLRSATLPTQFTGHVPVALLDEIQRGLLEETDYLREADNLEFFGKGLSGLEYVAIPLVYRKLTTDRVLTMSYIEGETLSDLLKRKPSQAFRDLLGIQLCEMYETQLQRLKVLHADHHPGNYLFQPNGTIGLIDFGCVKRISFDVLELRRCYRHRTWRESIIVRVDEVLKFTNNDRDTIQTQFLRLMPHTMMEIAEVLVKRRWGIIFSDWPAFVTSDCPVVLCRGMSTKTNFGFGTPGTNILFPISPTRLLAIDDRWDYEFAHYKLTKPDIYNRIIARAAHRFVYAHNESPDLAAKISEWRAI